MCLFIIKLSINKHYICRPIRCGHPPPSALFRLVEVPQQTVELMNVPGECGEVRPQARTQLQRRQVSECEALRAARQVKRMGGGQGWWEQMARGWHSNIQPNWSKLIFISRPSWLWTLDSSCQNSLQLDLVQSMWWMHKNTSTCGTGFSQLVQPLIFQIVFGIVFGFLPDFNLPFLSACISHSIETQHFIQLIQSDMIAFDLLMGTQHVVIPWYFSRYRCSGDSTSPRVCDERERPLPDWLAPREWSWGSVSSGNAIDHQIYVPSCVALHLWRVHGKMSFLFHCWAT